MIIIIDNYDSFTYNLVQMIAPYVAFKVLRNDCYQLKDIAALKPEGIIISPGPGTPEKAGIGIDLVKNFAATVPILGVCLGHQIIATAFGGVVQKTKALMHGKQSIIFHRRINLYKELSLPFLAGRYHSLIAERNSLPSELVIDAETSDGLIMGISHKQYPCFGVQFHPESILTPEGSKIINNFLKICKQYQTQANVEAVY